jgi:hypothetical protein
MQRRGKHGHGQGGRARDEGRERRGERTREESGFSYFSFLMP